MDAAFACRLVWLLVKFEGILIEPSWSPHRPRKAGSCHQPDRRLAGAVNAEVFYSMLTRTHLR